MIVKLLDESLHIQIYYEKTDSAYDDNICINIQEDCPPEECLFRAQETNLFITVEQARSLAEALTQAAAKSSLARRPKTEKERVYAGDAESLRTTRRKELLQVDRVVDLCLEEGEIQTVLDVGTGSGLFAQAFLKRGLKVAGIDNRPEMVESAQQYLPDASLVRLAPAEAIPLPDKSYDLVFLGLVLHETKDAQAALKEAIRTARKRVVILEWPYREEEVGPPMEHRLRADEISAMINTAGFPGTDTILLDNLVLYRLNL